MKTNLISGGTMEYEDRGQGPPVLLLHAFPLAHEMWRPQVEALAGDYRVIAPDLRGFGGTSGFERDPSIEQMADDVHALLDALNIMDRVVLAGLSMGGYVALNFIRWYPTRVRALVLADTRAEADSEEARAKRDELITFAESHTAAEVLDQMLPKLLGDATRAGRPEVVEEVRRIASAQPTAGIVTALKALRDRRDAGEWLHEIVVPALVLVGSEDALTPPAMADSLAGRIRNARRVTIEGAGHLSNLEQPQAFTDAVREFLRTLA